MKNKTTTTPVKSSISNETAPRRGFAEVHESMDISTFDISDYMVATITGEDAPVRTIEKAANQEVIAPLNDELGHIATQEVVAAPKSIEKSARRGKKSKDTDKSLWEKTPGSSKVIAGLGMLAVTAAVMGHQTKDIADNWHEVIDAKNIHTVSAQMQIDSAPVTKEFSSVIIAGGAGQGDPKDVIGELQSKGYQNGYNVEGVYYPAQIGPVVGQMSMEDSGAIGEADMYAKAIDDIRAGRETQLIGYSEGSYVALQTANRIIAENGGVKPDNLHVTIIGSPYAQGGILGSNSPFAKAASPFLDVMGIPQNVEVPAGTHIVYYDTDFWANSGNQVPTSMMRQLFEIGFGGHNIPDPNDPSYTFTDSDGVIHTVYTHRNDPILQAMIDGGLPIADTASANRAINALFPLDGSEPNVHLALNELANTLENQGDPFSTMAADFIRSLPPELADLGQSGMNAINKISEGSAKVASGDVLGGMQLVMEGMNEFMGGMQKVQGSGQGNILENIISMFGTGMSGALQKSTGYDFSPQINGFMNEFQTVSSVNANTNVNASVDYTSYLDQFVSVVQTQTPQINGQSSLNTSLNMNLPVGEVSAEMNLQGNLFAPTDIPSTTLGGNADVSATIAVPSVTQESLSAEAVASGFFDTSATTTPAPVPSAAAAESSAPSPTSNTSQSPSVTQESLSSGAVAGGFFETPTPTPVVADSSAGTSSSNEVNIFHPTTPAPAPQLNPEVSAPSTPTWEPAPAAPVVTPEAPAPAPEPVALPDYVEQTPEPVFTPEAPAPVVPQPVFELPPAAPAPAPFVMPDLSSNIFAPTAPAPSSSYDLAPAPSASTAETGMPSYAG